jgi:hypothetical protein
MGLTSTEKHQRMIDRRFPPGHEIWTLPLSRRHLVALAPATVTEPVRLAKLAADNRWSILRLQEEIQKEARGAGLDGAEQEQLAQSEAISEDGLRDFFEVALALLRIRDERLYRQTHATFEDYCREKWGMTSRQYHLLGLAARMLELKQSSGSA